MLISTEIAYVLSDVCTVWRMYCLAYECRSYICSWNECCILPIWNINNWIFGIKATIFDNELISSSPMLPIVTTVLIIMVIFSPPGYFFSMALPSMHHMPSSPLPCPPILYVIANDLNIHSRGSSFSCSGECMFQIVILLQYYYIPFNKVFAPSLLCITFHK